MKKILSILNLCALLCLTGIPCFSQNGYLKGDMVQNMDIKKILNYPSLSSSFNDLRNEITIVDFFGTWCVPCLKALPHLSAIQQKFKEHVNIILVSNESETQLSKFIKARNNFYFPVIVDETNSLNQLFQPPALPYTVVLNKGGKIIAITEAANITETALQNWLSAPIDTVNNSIVAKEKQSGTMTSFTKSNNETIRLSQDFIYTAKTGEPAEKLVEQLKNIDYSVLQKTLSNDNAKKAFWINLYNGYTQVILKNDPQKYERRNSFFKDKQIQLAGKEFSLDDIEHDILRRSKIKWSLGHFNKIFPSQTDKQLRVDQLDYRIHFALNCGAASCPPIAFYDAENIDQQLDLATRAYLSGEAEYDKEENTVELPALMGWFRADFGGKKGMINILKKHKIIPQDADPKIKFKKYDWNLFLDNYKTETP